MLRHMEHIVITVVLYETSKFVRVTTREYKVGNFALHSEEKNS